jgi:hypothetical protein
MMSRVAPVEAIVIIITAEGGEEMVYFTYAGIVLYVATLLAYLAGLVVAVILLIRTRRTAAILATVSFAVLVLISIGQIALTLPAMSRQLVRAGAWLAWLLNCCCGLFDMAAIVCLIVALWQAVSGAMSGQATPGSAETWETVEETPEETAQAAVELDQAVEKSTHATTKLDEEPEGTPYATRVLRETQEEETAGDE